MDELKRQAQELGIDVDGRWSEETLQARIKAVMGAPVANPDLSEPKPVMQATREKTLHELNLEARAYDRANRSLHDHAANAARDAVKNTLNEKRIDGKRVRKPVRPVAE